MSTEPLACWGRIKEDEAIMKILLLMVLFPALIQAQTLVSSTGRTKPVTGAVGQESVQIRKRFFRQAKASTGILSVNSEQESSGVIKGPEPVYRDSIYKQGLFNTQDKVLQELQKPR